MPVIIEADRMTADDMAAAVSIGFDFAVDHAQKQLARRHASAGVVLIPDGGAKAELGGVNCSAVRSGSPRGKSDSSDGMTAPPFFPHQTTGRGRRQEQQKAKR